MYLNMDFQHNNTHDPSEIILKYWFGAELLLLLLLSILKTVMLLNIFVETPFI